VPLGRGHLARSVTLLATVAFLAEAGALLCSAQTTKPPTIRVETREVVFPVLVLKERKGPKGLLVEPNGEEFYAWTYKTQEVAGLTAKSFRVFEDGLEQKIQHFSVEGSGHWLVKDNVDEYTEHSWTPTGIWSGSYKKITREVKRWISRYNTDSSTPTVVCCGSGIKQILPYRPRRSHVYLISYVPPDSPAGSCHQVEVKVAKRHAKVFAPDQYCNTKNPLSDPLNGRDVGNALLEYAKSQRPDSIPLALQLAAFLGPSGASRINVSVEIPPGLLLREWKGNEPLLSVALLGLVYDKNRTLVTRFSDAACPTSECGYGYEGAIPPSNSFIPDISGAEMVWGDLMAPKSYRTQLELEPGDYQIELAITDGEKFGRAEASVSVDDFRKSELAISGIALCKRYHTPSADERGPTRAPQYVPLMFAGQEFTPAGDTHFKRGEPLMAYLEIYNNSQTDTAGPPKFYLEMKVTDTKTGELKIGTGLRPVDSVTSSVGSAIPVVWNLAVDKLPAGTYRLQAQASDSAGHRTEWRETSFSVE